MSTAGPTPTGRPPGWVPWGVVGVAAAFALFLLCAGGNALTGMFGAPRYAEAGYALALAGCAAGVLLVAVSGVLGRWDRARHQRVLRVQLIAVAVLAVGWIAGIAVAALGAAGAGELSAGKWAPILATGLVPMLVQLILGRHIRRRIGTVRPM
ncbi:hypothetical protein [Cryptosporangium sp. NPDC048952]|uniref:hypothetical protein n=1 Tax=Cryptosporangium sp. NPDC048952 TaxID=3363961 RepID=UPI00371E96E8